MPRNELTITIRVYEDGDRTMVGANTCGGMTPKALAMAIPELKKVFGKTINSLTETLLKNMASELPEEIKELLELLEAAESGDEARIKGALKKALNCDGNCGSCTKHKKSDKVEIGKCDPEKMERWKREHR